MKINGFTLFLSIFLATLMAASFYDPLRYIKYLLPLLPLPFYLRKQNAGIDTGIFRYYYTFIFFYTCTIAFLFVQNLLEGDLSERFFPNAIFIVSPLLFITLILPYFKGDKIPQYVYLIFFVNILIFLKEEGPDLFDVLTNLSVLRSAIITSEVPTESNLAYIFGFFVIYFYMEKYPLTFKVLAIILFLLCFKRIVIAAGLVCFASYFLIKSVGINIPRYRLTFTILAVAINLLFIKFVQLLVSGEFDDFVFEKTGISTDQFMMGRKTFYTEAFDEAGTMNWTGLGMGTIDDIMFRYYGIPVNLHSEVLKNYFEFGIIIFVIWLFLITYKNLFSTKAAIIFLYFNILILTDNVFIYFEVMFYFYFFILIFLNQRLKHLNQGNEGSHN